MFTFVNPNGLVVTFGPGDAVRRWSGEVGVAHDFLVGFGGQAFDSPGPGGHFQVTSVVAVLANARWVEVTNPAATPQDASQRIQNAIAILGTPWTFGHTNCQDTVSYVVTGKPSSFQREGLFALGFVLLLGMAALPRMRELT